MHRKHRPWGCPGGIAAERDAIIERAAFAYQDWMAALAAQADIEDRLLAVLDELGLTGLVTTIPGLSPVGAAVILGQTGTRPAMTALGPGSSTPAWRHRPTSPGSTAAGPAALAGAAPGCGPRHGG